MSNIAGIFVSPAPVNANHRVKQKASINWRSPTNRKPGTASFITSLSCIKNGMIFEKSFYDLEK